VDWRHLAQDGDQWRALANVEISVSIKCGEVWFHLLHVVNNNNNNNNMPDTTKLIICPI
jgi:hypothetical protein